MSSASHHSLHYPEGNHDHVVPKDPLGPEDILDCLQGLWHERGDCDPRLRPCRALADGGAEGRRCGVEGLNLLQHQCLPIKALPSLISLSSGQGT